MQKKVLANVLELRVERSRKEVDVRSEEKKLCQMQEIKRRREPKTRRHA